LPIRHTPLVKGYFLALVNSDTAGIVSLNYYYKLERHLGTSNRQFFELIYKRHNNSKGQLTLTFFDMLKFDRSKFFDRHSTVDGQIKLGQK
jgi:hypothetical protein